MREWKGCVSPSSFSFIPCLIFRVFKLLTGLLFWDRRGERRHYFGWTRYPDFLFCLPGDWFSTPPVPSLENGRHSFQVSPFFRWGARTAASIYVRLVTLQGGGGGFGLGENSGRTAGERGGYFPGKCGRAAALALKADV